MNNEFNEYEDFKIFLIFIGLLFFMGYLFADEIIGGRCHYSNARDFVLAREDRQERYNWRQNMLKKIKKLNWRKK
jgi:hypothetical protein